MCGSLKSFNHKVEGASRIPSIFTFIVACLTVLSAVDHKELRFYAPVAQIGCFAQAYGIVQLWQFKSIRWTLKYIFIVVMAVDGIKLIFSLL
jgi:hypothetical protein